MFSSLLLEPLAYFLLGGFASLFAYSSPPQTPQQKTTVLAGFVSDMLV